MHPALSVIVFTTASGAGYGLLFLLSLLGAFGLLPADTALGLAAFGVAFALVTGGLVASTLHLGHPERAWRALSQWRSSWLSKEGVAALVAYLPAALYAFGWIALGRNVGLWSLVGLLAALAAAATVYCTGMIYASLRTVPRWHGPWTVPNYALLALASGAVWLAGFTLAFAPDAATLPLLLALAATAAAAILRWHSWRVLDAAPASRTAGDATGLGGLGRVRLLEPPHTEANYLLREMGFKVARRHAAKLRRVALLLAFACPFVLVLLAFLTPAPFGAALALAGALAAMAGLLVERWLFFAEAKHTVTLYYGASAV
ncbi:MAG: dimethyl sulfoxide reductase anchor subunit [Geminicoccaceae bacterium]|nr:dimethyl sulfoxide reductase anchor subunit [Geminicoccaceae bacterium]